MEEPSLLLPAPIPQKRAKFPFKIIGSVFGFLILTVGLGFGLLQVQRNQEIKKSSASSTSFVTNICGKPTNTGGVTGTGCASSCSSSDGKNGSCRDVDISGYDTFIDVQVCSGDGDHTKCDGSNGGINIANINGGGTANTSNYSNYCRVQFDFYKDNGSGRQLIDFLVYWDSANCGVAPTSPPNPTTPPNPTSPPQPTTPPVPTATPRPGTCNSSCEANNGNVNACNATANCAYYLCTNQCLPRGTSGVCPGTGPINCSALPTSTPIPTSTPTPTIVPTPTPTTVACLTNYTTVSQNPRVITFTASNPVSGSLIFEFGIEANHPTQWLLNSVAGTNVNWTINPPTGSFLNPGQRTINLTYNGTVYSVCLVLPGIPTPAPTSTIMPTNTPTPTPTPMAVCQQIKVYRGTPLVEIATSDIQKGNSITFRASANATNTTISTIRFTVTIGTGTPTNYDRTASLVGGVYQADLQLDITQAATYTVTARPI